MVKTNCKWLAASNLKVKHPTNGEFQLWHTKQYEMAADGIEFIYNEEDVDVTKEEVPAPFKKQSNLYYSLEIDGLISTSKTGLLIMPHHLFYSSDEWPLAVTNYWETSWWPFPLSIMFKHFGVAKFRKGQPFAQGIVVDSLKCEVETMGEKEIKEKTDLAISLEKDKYITRKWITNSGIEQDNFYNVLSRMRERSLRNDEMV